MAKRGRRPRDEIDSLKARLWFSAVSIQSGMNDRQLEEHFLPRMREDHAEVFERSNAWGKYMRGERVPDDPTGAESSLVELVDREFPETAQWIRSPLWLTLRRRILQPEEAIELVRRAKPTIRNLFRIDDGNLTENKLPQLEITAEKWDILIRSASVDSFAAMMTYWRSRSRTAYSLEDLCRYSCRLWLHFAHAHFPALSRHREEWVAVLTKWAPELESLSYLGLHEPELF